MKEVQNVRGVHAGWRGPEGIRRSIDAAPGAARKGGTRGEHANECANERADATLCKWSL